MGWNDRLPEDPFIPSDAYYTERAEYEAWLDYLDACAQEDATAGLSSQNVDPAVLSQSPQQNTPERQGLLARLWAQIRNPHGQKETTHEQEQQADESRESVSGLPF